MIEIELIIKFDFEEGRDNFIELMEAIAKNIPSIYKWEIKVIEEKKRMIE